MFKKMIISLVGLSLSSCAMLPSRSMDRLADLQLSGGQAYTSVVSLPKALGGVSRGLPIGLVDMGILQLHLENPLQRSQFGHDLRFYQPYTGDLPLLNQLQGFDLDRDEVLDYWELTQGWLVLLAQLEQGRVLAPNALQGGEEGGIYLSPQESMQVHARLRQLAQQQPELLIAETLQAVEILIELSERESDYEGDDDVTS
uniref:ABC-type transport auxiliary lipoprotein component domain-containing protein n=1 Tax=Magnetococcus massalia (strain MO-1) TaxID=451514 RepID=A0A1S7LL75_MAGMO|nr:conserved exported protein of unknown function [Candidatus Magnetococcus massalia]